MKKYLTLLQRELWEYKTSLILLPLLSTATLFILLCIAFVRLAPSERAEALAISTTPITQTDTTSPSEHNPDASPATSHSPNEDNNQSDQKQRRSGAAAENAQLIKKLDDEFSEFKSKVTNFVNPATTNARFVAFTIWSTTIALAVIFFFCATSYLHRALFDDRKTREILFWRSMPVSETTNVLAKLFILYGFIPGTILILTLSVGTLSWAFTNIVSLGSINSPLAVITLCLKIYFKCLLVLFALSPIVCWSLCASALAKRSPFIVSTIIPIGVMVGDRYINWAVGVNLHVRDTIHAYGDFFLVFIRHAPNNWDAIPTASILGVVAASALLLAVTVWLRNNRFEI